MSSHAAARTVAVFAKATMARRMAVEKIVLSVAAVTPGKGHDQAVASANVSLPLRIWYLGKEQNAVEANSACIRR
jgi:hypothetical protein